MNNIWATYQNQMHVPVFSYTGLIGICPMEPFMKASRGTGCLTMEITIIGTHQTLTATFMTALAVADDKVISTWGNWESPTLSISLQYLERHEQVAMLEKIIKHFPAWPENICRFQFSK